LRILPGLWLLWVLAVVAAAQNVAAQAGGGFGGGPGGGAPQGGQPPKDPEYVRPKEALEPLPAPLSAEEEAARERAKERGVLVSKNPQPDTISEVRIVGARKMEADAILLQIGTRLDRKPDRRQLQQDIRRIFQLDVFDDVVVEAQPGPNDSVRLRFVLTEKPSIDEILLEGNSEINKDDIMEVVDLKMFQVLDVARIKANVEKIRRLYVDKGFFLADVSYEVRPSKGNDASGAQAGSGGLLDLFSQTDKEASAQQDAKDKAQLEGGTTAPATPPTSTDAARFVDVVFVMHENAKVKVEHIAFVGNSGIASDELAGVLRTRENHPLGLLLEWGTYKQEASEIDLLALEAYYQDRGYLNVKIGKPRVQLTSDKSRMVLFIPISEGKQYRLRSFDVDGDLVVEDETDAQPAPIVFVRKNLVDRTKIRSGELFSRTQIAMDVQALADRYRDAGYAFVNVAPDMQLHDDDNTLDLRLLMQAGPRVTIERIDITGNVKTHDSVVRRELRVFEGELYSATSLRLSEQRVNALGYFEKVSVSTKQGSEPDRMVLTFDVKEKSTGQFQIGAGFSNAEAFILNGQVSYNNLLGLGTTFSTSLQLSQFRRIFDVRYIDPYFVENLWGLPLTFSFSAFNTSRFFLDFTRLSTGGDVTFGYPVGRALGDGLQISQALNRLRSDAGSGAFNYIPDLDNFQVFGTYSLERVEIDDSNFSVRLLGLQTSLPRWTSSLRGAALFDMRNNRLFPTSGWFVQGSVEIANPLLGSGVFPGTEAALKGALKGAGLRDIPLCTGLGCLKTNGLANTFLRTSATLRWYLNFDSLLPVAGVVLKGNHEVGLLASANQLVFENYYMGGFNTIRGYFIRSISPVARVGSASDPSAPLVEFRTGGNKQFFTNLELEFPIFEAAGLRGVLFADAGNVYGADENFFYVGTPKNDFLSSRDCDGACWDPRTQLPLGLFYSVGAGVRWLSPLGPLRFEWGIPLTRRPAQTFGFPQGDQPFQFEFNVGSFF
jgi:outer membrane protein insertion porin family